MCFDIKKLCVLPKNWIKLENSVKVGDNLISSRIPLEPDQIVH